MKARIYIATTQGPVLVERISREAAPRSAVCLKRTTRVLPISGGYDAFVRSPSGVIDREFGPFDAGAFRLDVSGDIGDGDSWQLGVYVAHGLSARGQLAGPEDDYDAVFWLTGTVDGDLNIGPVGGVAAKIDASRELIKQSTADGHLPAFVIPAANADAASNLDDTDGAVVHAQTVADVMERLGLAPPTARRAAQAIPARPVGRSAIPLAGVVAVSIAVLLGVGWYAVAPNVPVAPGVAPSRPSAESATPVTLAVVGLYAPAGGTCPAVLFDRVIPREVALHPNANGAINMARSEDLCALALTVDALEPVFARAELRLTSGRFAAQRPRPPELSGATQFAGMIVWRIDLPVRQSGPIVYDVVVRHATAPIGRAEVDSAEKGNDDAVSRLSIRHRIGVP